VYEATLTLGLPHTNRWGLAEHLLLMHAGHIHWTAMAETIGVPLSQLHAKSGAPVYATFYFIEEIFPEHAALDGFRLDDTVRFRLAQRAYKRTTTEAQLIFDHAARLPALAGEPSPISPAAGCGRHPYVRFGNIFITPAAGNNRLRIAAPVEGDFSAFAVLPNEENPYQITRDAASSGRLGLLDDRWQPMTADPYEVDYAIDPDRDTNGAGLIYFANYVIFMDAAERAALAFSSAASRQSDRHVVQQRRVAFYGNASPTDTVQTRVTLFHDPARPQLLGRRYAIYRQQDHELICLSEAIKRSVRV
jgi:probable biosynthetic protein (TIGR04098 family)